MRDSFANRVIKDPPPPTELVFAFEPVGLTDHRHGDAHRVLELLERARREVVAVQQSLLQEALRGLRVSGGGGAGNGLNGRTAPAAHGRYRVRNKYRAKKTPPRAPRPLMKILRPPPHFDFGSTIFFLFWNHAGSSQNFH